MQYWKKRKQRKNNKVTLSAKDSKKWEKPEKKNKKERSVESYRKDILRKEGITWELEHNLNQCPDCWSDEIVDK